MEVDILFTNFIFNLLFLFIHLYIYFPPAVCDTWCNTYCSADAREVALSQAGVWFDEDILKKRATFRGRVSEPSILAISNVSLTDQSVYRCRVDFREAKSRNSRINLTVIGKKIFSAGSFCALANIIQPSFSFEQFNSFLCVT